MSFARNVGRHGEPIADPRFAAAASTSGPWL